MPDVSDELATTALQERIVRDASCGEDFVEKVEDSHPAAEEYFHKLPIFHNRVSFHDRFRPEVLEKISSVAQHHVRLAPR